MMYRLPFSCTGLYVLLNIGVMTSNTNFNANNTNCWEKLHRSGTHFEIVKMINASSYNVDLCQKRNNNMFIVNVVSKHEYSPMFKGKTL